MELEESNTEALGDIDKSKVNPSWTSLSILPCTSELERTDPERATLLYERAIRENAGSYKLWHAYLLHRTRQLDGKKTNDTLYEDVNNCFERALVFMHKMPRIWMEYCTLLDRQLLITRTRRTFNRALEALPITQHSRIWPLYINFIKRDHVPTETAVRVYKRYLQFQPEDAESFIDYLYVKNRFDEAAKLLCDIINRPNFHSKKKKTKYQLWEDLCDMICEFGDRIESINSEAVLRDGISKYQDQQGRLWNALARYYIQVGLFNSARNVFDEAIHQVTTKKDFVEVWEAYTNFEEKYLEHLLQQQEELNEEQMLEIEMRQTSLEELISNNGLLLNRVALRQNPHNVREWQKRITLCEQFDGADFNEIDMKREIYNEALRTVDPKQALGNYEELWIEYAFHEANVSGPERARKVFESALEAKFAKYEDKAKVWASYIEFELGRRSNKALGLAKRAVSQVKNLKLWSLYVDLEENFDNFESTKAAYDRILDLRIATPQIVLNYAKFLEENQYFKEAFRAYERGLGLFKWPHCYMIWQTYLFKFFERYKYKKLDRARDLLDQCLKECPGEYGFEFYVLYAKLEEENGLFSRMQEIYNKGLKRLDSEGREKLYKIYISSIRKMGSLDNK